MASYRQNNQASNGRALQPPLGTGRGSKSPITPRLATTTATTSSQSGSKRAIDRLAEPHTRPSPSPSGTNTPVRAFIDAHITPRSSSRKTRVDSPTSTSGTPSDGTPSQLRPRVLSPTNSESSVRPRLAANTSRPQQLTLRAKTFAETNSTAKSPLATRPPAIAKAQENGSRGNSPLFFRADEAKKDQQSQQVPQRRPMLAKAQSFVYANGQEQEEEEKPRFRSASPAPSAIVGARPANVLVPAAPQSDSSLPSPLLSPPLSSLSSRSPPVPSPTVTSPNSTPPSPPKENIHLSYRKGASQILAHGLTPGGQRGDSPSSGFSLADRLLPKKAATLSTTPLRAGLGPDAPAARDAHMKSNSLSSIDSASPNQSRKRSMTSSEFSPALRPPIFTAKSQGLPTIDAQKEFLPLITTNLEPPPVPGPEIVQSPVKTAPDPAADARRERKVLDLEISNSSLLAINKSLEREMKKQKAELKRFRRLSRAGQFALVAAEGHSHDLNTVDEEGDFPDIPLEGRPSSPFLENPDDFSDDESYISSSASLTSSAQADQDASRRADDEMRLRADLSKHRELLLDTQMMNLSLQRCLARSENLILDGRKALDYKIPFSAVRLGGRILSTDHDEEDAEDGARDLTPASSRDEMEAVGAG